MCLFLIENEWNFGYAHCQYYYCSLIYCYIQLKFSSARASDRADNLSLETNIKEISCTFPSSHCPDSLILYSPSCSCWWRVSRPSTTLGERGVNTGKADGINCKKTGSSLGVNASAGQFSTPGTCLATIEKSCLAPRKYKHHNMWPGHKLFLAIPWRQYRYNYHIVTIKLDSLFLPTITPHCCYCHDW